MKTAKRLENIETHIEKQAIYEQGRLAKLIAQGAYFDELTPEEQEAYKAYKESLGGVADDIAGAELEIMFLDKTKEEAYHFPLTKRKRPPTPEEHRQRVQEVEDYLFSLNDED